MALAEPHTLQVLHARRKFYQYSKSLGIIFNSFFFSQCLIVRNSTQELGEIPRKIPRGKSLLHQVLYSPVSCCRQTGILRCSGLPAARTKSAGDLLLSLHRSRQ